MRCIIAGSREGFTVGDVERAVEQSGWADEITTVLSGGARGVDRDGEEWARLNSKILVIHPADWNRHGKRAGPIRNAQMAQEADALIALWDGVSPGTQSMIAIARQRGLRVFVYRKEAQEQGEPANDA